METVTNFNRILLKIQDNNILRTNSLSQETIEYTCFKSEIVSLAQRSIHLEQNFSKNLKILSFIRKTRVIENSNHHPINSINYAAAYYQFLEAFPGPLLPEKKMKKLQTFYKIA